MRITVKTNKTRYSVFETIKCEVTLINNGVSQPVDCHCYCGFLINGENIYYEESTNRDFELSLVDHWKHIGKIQKIDFQVEIKIKIADATMEIMSDHIPIEIDLSGIEIIKINQERDSNYVKHNNKVYFISPFVRCHGRRYKILNADISTAIALDNNYLIDKERVFKDGVMQKGVDPNGFRVYNLIFAGNKENVFSSYGNAKINNPAKFEVLDDGNKYALRKENEDSYHAGYARDDRYVYFFCESTGSSHATVIKSCKNPDEFISLDYGYGKDGSNVYLEGKKVKGANPKNWTMLNRLFSKDEKNIYYLNDKVEGAVVNSFRVIEDAFCCSEDIFDSRWGQDENHYYEMRDKRCLEDYLSEKKKWEEQ